MYWCIDVLMYWCIDVLMYWFIDLLIYWFVDSFTFHYLFIYLFVVLRTLVEVKGSKEPPIQLLVDYNESEAEGIKRAKPNIASGLVQLDTQQEEKRLEFAASLGLTQLSHMQSQEEEQVRIITLS